MSIAKIFMKVIGYSGSYRFGRALYMQSRGDIENDMATNGELMIQRSVVEAMKQRSGDESLICFDVGANVGEWSEALLSACESSQCQAFELYVFEPVPSTANVLKKRLGHNEHIHYAPLAMSSTGGEDIIYLNGETAGTNSLHCEHTEIVSDSITIEKVAASQFCLENDISMIHLLKCDTEGHDMEVILGAMPLLKEGKIVVFQFEYNHRWIFSRHYLKDAFDAIEGLPYQLGKVCQDHIEVYDKWYPEHERFFEANYVFLRHDAVAWFNVRQCKLNAHNSLVVATS